MIAHAPQSHPFSSGALALLVHVGFFSLLIFGVNWRATEPPGMVVDLWSSLPAPPQQALAPPPPPPPEPVPVKKIEPKPAPPVQTSKTDIALKDKKRKEDKPKLEPTKPNKPEKLKQEQPKQDQLKQDQARQAETARQQEALNQLARLAQARQDAAHQTVVGEYSDRIKGKIRQKLNRALCGDGNPQLIFDIALLPTGQIRGKPVLRKSSGIPACDKAVEDAILLSEPLPVPTQPEIFSYFRDLNLNFKPNE